jgi:hypothetical protein
VVKVPPSGDQPGAEPSLQPICLSRSHAVDTVPATIQSVAQVAPTVVVGTFEGYGDAQWNSPTGARPGPDDGGVTLIYRSVKLTPTAILRGSMADASNVFVPGGDIGCNHETFDSDPSLEVGTDYVFFLQSDPGRKFEAARTSSGGPGPSREAQSRRPSMGPWLCRRWRAC